MKQNFEFRKILESSGDRVWAILAAVDDVDTWFPIVMSCRVDGNRRFCELANGAAIEETITGVDAKNRTLHYTVDKGLPVDAYSGSFAVLRRDDGRDEIRWQVEVEAESEVLGSIEAMLEEAAEAGLNGIDQAAQRAA